MQHIKVHMSCTLFLDWFFPTGFSREVFNEAWASRSDVQGEVL